MKLSEFVFRGLGGMPPKFWLKTTPGTYLLRIPSDVTFVWFEVQGGGGGGGGTYRGGVPNRKNGGGGGAAGLRVEDFMWVAPGANITCSVGAGGAGGQTYNSGVAGAQSTFMSVVAQGGGGGGGAGTTFAGRGGRLPGGYNAAPGGGAGGDGIIIESPDSGVDAAGLRGFFSESFFGGDVFSGSGGRGATDVYVNAESGVAGYVRITYWSNFEIEEVG